MASLKYRGFLIHQTPYIPDVNICFSSGAVIHRAKSIRAAKCLITKIINKSFPKNQIPYTFRKGR